ncbi:Hypothetical protein CINCED_3A020150 [Cinara cedri]|uniref:Uncharacterized protein n=1 Tax=Cinara cedri TaxID=506608 RepID=A0A5E4NKI5_9HEMI|nr:Hypothetical protein CINCED_3A020150 [Cinara cedri]
MNDDNGKKDTAQQPEKKQNSQYQQIFRDFVDSRKKTNRSIFNQRKHEILCFVLKTMIGIMLINTVLWLLGIYTKNFSEHILKYYLLLYVTSTVAGRVVSLIHLPPLMGMILAGIAIRNLKPSSHKHEEEFVLLFVFLICETTTSIIMAIDVLMLNISGWHKIGCVIVRLAFLPLIVEFIAISTVAIYYYEPNFNWKSVYGYGFFWPILSPSVLMPSLLRFKRMGYGEKSKVIPLLIAASTLVEVITNISDGLLILIDQCDKNKQNKLFDLIQLYVKELCVEIILAIIMGVFMIFVPPIPWSNVDNKPKDQKSQAIKKKQKTIFLISIIRLMLFCAVGCIVGIVKWFNQQPVTWSLGGAISLYVASTGWKWRWRTQNSDKQTELYYETAMQDHIDGFVAVLEYVWDILQPMVFGILGSILNFEHVIIDKRLYTGILVVVIGFVVRTIVTTCSIFGSGLNFKEVVFINIAWFFNATILTYLTFVLIVYDKKDSIDLSQHYSTITVFSVFSRAQIGSFLMWWFGPKLLS